MEAINTLRRLRERVEIVFFCVWRETVWGWQSGWNGMGWYGMPKVSLQLFAKRFDK